MVQQCGENTDMMLEIMGTLVYIHTDRWEQVIIEADFINFLTHSVRRPSRLHGNNFWLLYSIITFNLDLGTILAQHQVFSKASRHQKPVELY